MPLAPGGHAAALLASALTLFTLALGLAWAIAEMRLFAAAKGASSKKSA